MADDVGFEPTGDLPTSYGFQDRCNKATLPIILVDIFSDRMIFVNIAVVDGSAWT